MNRETKILRRSAVRRIVKDALTEYGIKATRIAPGFFDSLETSCVNYVKQQAVASVADNRKTVR